MTEVERIIKEGILPESFFKPETICDFYVDENRKKVWAIEIDLYLSLAKVCEKHGLKLFTDGGTTLGAVRHKGFIPWDDDLDVCLLREDYEKLKLLASEFKHPYFLQSSDTDPEYAFSFMKLCNSNTAYDVRPFTHAKFNHGLHIDIFPIDKVTIEDYVPRRQKIADIIAVNSAYMRKDLPEKTDSDKEQVSKYESEFIKSPLTRWTEIEKIAMEDQKTETNFLSLLVSVQYAPEKKIWPKHIFSDSVEMEFSGIKVKVPIGYDEQLKIYFGNYMEFPPVEKRGTWHSAKFLPDIDYRTYYRQEYGVDHSSVGYVKYCMHAGGEIDGQMLTNTREAYDYWLSKGQHIFEFDVCETDDHKYVTTHDFNYEAFARMGIRTIPLSCTSEWFLSQRLYDGRYHALSLVALIEDVSKGVISGLMIDPKDFTFDGTKRLMEYLEQTCISKGLTHTKRLTIELYNSDMINAGTPYADRFTLQYCVDDDIQQGNSAETRVLPNDDLISFLKSAGIKAVSFPWKQAVENLSLLKELKKAGFIIYSRTRNDLFIELLKKCGIDYNIVDHFVTPEQFDSLKSYKKQYYAKYQPQIDKAYRKKVLTVGVYDMLHIGHVNLFRRAQRLGDSLTVAVQSSEVVLKYKPTAKLVYSTEERMYMVKSIRFVDDVIIYEAVDDIVRTADFDIFVTGPDQCHEGFQRAIQWCRDNGKEAIVLPRTEGISSSWLKEQIKSM